MKFQRLSRRAVWAAPLAAVVLAAGCGGGSTADPAALIASGKAALKTAHSAGFDVKLSLQTQGQAAAEGALLRGPVTIELKGHAGKTGGTRAFDATFAVDTSAASIKGEVMSPDGKTVYLKVPLLGDTWQSIPVSSAGRSVTTTRLDPKLAGLDPAKWLKNITATSGDGNDTVSADLDTAAIAATILKGLPQADAAAARKEIAQLTRAIDVAHGSVSFDSSSHLPSAFTAQLTVTVPPAMAAQAKGITGFDLQIDATFDDWNQPVEVTAPAGARPLDLSRLGSLTPAL